MLGHWGRLVSRVLIDHATSSGERHFLHLRRQFVG